MPTKSDNPSLCAPSDSLMKEFIRLPKGKKSILKKKKSIRFNPFEKK